jgi:O-antigen ligase
MVKIQNPNTTVTLIGLFVLSIPFARFLSIDLVAEINIADIFLIILFFIYLYRPYLIVWAIPFMLLIASSVISLLLNFDIANPIVPASYTLKLILVMSIIKQRVHINYIMRVIVLSSFVWLTVALFFTDGMAFFIDTDISYNKNELTNNLSMLTFVSLYLISNRDNSNKLLIFFLKTIFLGSFIIILISLSRGAIVAVLLSLGLVLMLRGRVLTIALLFITAFFIINNMVMDNEYQNRRLNTLIEFDANNFMGSGKTSADRLRFDNLVRAYTMFKESPIIGVGPGSFIKQHPDKRVVHNTYMSTLAELGLFGFVATIAFVIMPFAYYFVKRKLIIDRGVIYLLAGYFFLVLHAFTIESLPKYSLYIMYAVVFSVMLNQRDIKMKQVKYNKLAR